ncbi:FecR domain-containing protein [Danxiaibacter flavus]|uniref:FecR domain-containing protein n=1 Tax=Danxiaibacter flavus TaxID=3049108 RepID=A0ABV3ZHR4_9BACT|nr:FecR domain-containing protein [Chitinophagaceae bacterium DXS]
MDKTQIRHLFKRYINGRANGPEQNLVNYWYRSFDDEVLDINDAEKKQIKAEIWGDIQQRISFNKSYRQKRNWWLRAAAVLLPLLLGAGILYYLAYYRNSAVQTFTTYTTGTGERKMLRMKDGTVLNLNAGSTIRIADDLSKERIVDLIDGEVFFDVHKQKGTPFVIKNQAITTTVLGTAFNISAYRNIQTFSIAVVRGSVQVADDGHCLKQLQKNEELVFNRNSRSFIVKPTEDRVLDWQKGYLVLNDVPFDEMAILVEKNFGVIITTNHDKIKKSRYTTQLSTEMKPMEAAEVLAAIHHFKISGGSNHILFYE